MKLTKLQRYTVYCILLYELENNCALSWLCIKIPEITGISMYRRNFADMREYFPELWNNRNPSKNELSTFLWNGTQERIEALNKCINETHP